MSIRVGREVEETSRESEPVALGPPSSSDGRGQAAFVDRPASITKYQIRDQDSPTSSTHRTTPGTVRSLVVILAALAAARSGDNDLDAIHPHVRSSRATSP